MCQSPMKLVFVFGAKASKPSTTLHLQHPIKSNKPYTYRFTPMATCPAPFLTVLHSLLHSGA